MSYHFPLVLFSLCVLFLSSALARAESIDLSVQSGREKVAVLELYTSEGCSSCPPADQFVRNLGRTGWYPQQVIPLSFHVTYWDYIGWRDTFAQAAFDRRQREIAERQKSRTVYTPQLVLDGRDVRRFGRFGHEVAALNDLEPGAHIELKVLSEALPELDVALSVRLEAAGLQKPVAVYVAIFENGLSSQVASGENRGKTLQHDFVVRRLIGPLQPVAAGKPLRYREKLAIPVEVNVANAGIAAFVQNTQDGTILQAVAAPLTTSP